MIDSGQAKRFQYLYYYYRFPEQTNEEKDMYLMNKQNGDLVEVLDMTAMVDPCRDELPGRYHAGEELQEPTGFSKSTLVFPSGEALPQCWVDPKYNE
jgi:hypothetical protein